MLAYREAGVVIVDPFSTLIAPGVAIGAGFFAFLYSFLYATLPVEGGERIVALENWDIDANNEMRRSMHDLVMWQREMKTVEEIGAFRTIGRNLIIPGGSAEPVQANSAWKRDRPSFPNYEAGTWGPASADAMMARDGRAWRRP